MSYPSDLLRWADTPTTLRTEPAEGTKNTGFAVNAKLPAQYFNWLVGVAGDWVAWLKDQIDNGWSYNLVPDSDDNRDLGSAALYWREVYGNDIFGTTVHAADQFELDSARSSVLFIPAGHFAVANPSSTPGWNFIPGTDPTYVDDDYLVSVTASAVAVAEVQIPQGAKVNRVTLDWAPYDTSGEMSFNAWKVKRYDHTAAALNSGGPLYAAAAATRAVRNMVPDQNNTGFDNSWGGNKWNSVRIRVAASTAGASGDKIYGAYLYLTHHSVGVFSDAPDAT